MKRKILLTGGSGLIGSYFIKNYSERFKNDKVIFPSHKEMDITNLDSIKRYFEANKPEVAIHFAAFRDANEAEKQRGDKTNSVWKINVDGSTNIAKVCREYGVYLIHISTDYVFSGHKQNQGPYSEKDEPNDSAGLLSWYGVTKREAERVLLKNFNNAAIVRICNITRPANNPELDYVGKILWLYGKKKIYPMFNDQYLTLTYIPALVDLIVELIRVSLPGIFHVSTPGLVTPHQVANYLIEQVYGKNNEIKATSIDPYLKLNPRRYPKYGGLKADLSQKKLGLKFLSWQEVVDSYAKEVKRGLRKKT